MCETSDESQFVHDPTPQYQFDEAGPDIRAIPFEEQLQGKVESKAIQDLGSAIKYSVACIGVPVAGGFLKAAGVLNETTIWAPRMIGTACTILAVQKAYSAFEHRRDDRAV